jgi:5'(3')-deoxyribonucleotidase
MIIGIDCDGVLRNIHAPLLKHWAEKTGIQVQYLEIQDWGIHSFMRIEEAGMSAPEFYDWWFNNYAIYAEALPISGSTEYVRKLSRLHTLILVSSQPTALMKSMTLDFVETYYRDCFSGIYFGGDKSLIMLNTMIEDSPRNLEQMSVKHKILFWQPWNASATGDWQRVQIWRECYELICSWERG